jgi:hypothetical protein
VVADSLARGSIAHEARTLLTRLDGLEPFSMQVAMVPGAAPRASALRGIERTLHHGRGELRRRARAFLAWLASPEGRAAPPSVVQARFVVLRLRFNAVLSEVDIFADALGQRAEHRTGVWLSGLDRLAEDALALPGYLDPPPVLCYLDRGLGAAIRRARTRLPSGGENPVAIVQVPRERMVGAGIASSIAHEVGHQAAALLGLVPSVLDAMRSRTPRGWRAARAWQLWQRWISEIVADLWGVARIGVGAVLGLVSVVSLPRYFVFRISVADPHPPPWMRVRVAAALGAAVYPHPQWDRLRRTWERLYPARGLPPSVRATLVELEATLPRLVDLLVEHRPAALRGRSIAEALHRPDRTPERLIAASRAWRADPSLPARAAPSLAFAIVGQARAAGEISARAEAEVLGDLLTRWGVESAVGGRFDGQVPAERLTDPERRRLVA